MNFTAKETVQYVQDELKFATIIHYRQRSILLPIRLPRIVEEKKVSVQKVAVEN